METKKRRRRRKKARIEFPMMVVLFLMLVLIPILCFWLGLRHVERTVPDHATGYVVETAADDIDGQ